MLDKRFDPTDVLPEDELLLKELLLKELLLKELLDDELLKLELLLELEDELDELVLLEDVAMGGFGSTAGSPPQALSPRTNNPIPICFLTVYLS